MLWFSYSIKMLIETKLLDLVLIHCISNRIEIVLEPVSIKVTKYYHMHDVIMMSCLFVKFVYILNQEKSVSIDSG